MDTNQWPEQLWPLEDVYAWIQTNVRGMVSTEDPPLIYNKKQWGVAAAFACGDETFVFKSCKLPLFSHRVEMEQILARHCAEHVPELIASQLLPGGESWTLHRDHQGIEVADSNDFGNLLRMVRDLAAMQLTLATRAQRELTNLPHIRVQEIPAMLAPLIQRIETDYLAAWMADDGALLDEFELPTNVLDQLEYYRPHVERWAAELAAGDWPLSVDHVDFHTGNALIEKQSNALLIFDWEEAGVSLPFFSLDRLLYDADDFEEDPQAVPQTEGPLRLSPNGMAVCNAYIDALPWHSRAQRERALWLALCLAPIKTAYEGELFNNALERTHGFAIHAARCIGRALYYWQAMREDEREKKNATAD